MFAPSLVLSLYLTVAAAALAARDSRVILVSFDGLGHEIFRSDPAAGELTVLHDLARRGVAAAVRPAHPSTTANSHAALWTGAYNNGVLYNHNPVLPKRTHSFRERRSGFRSESLTAEPIWVAAGRQGVRAVAHQVTQGFPFLPINTAPDAAAPPFVINGYQTETLAPQRALRADDVEWTACDSWTPPLPEGSRCFAWQSGKIRFHAAIPSDSGPRRMLVATEPGAEGISVRYAPAEPFYGSADAASKDPQGGSSAARRTTSGRRPLARHFSEPLFVAPEAAAFFRLFEFADDGSDFLLYQTTVQELGLHDPSGSGASAARRLATEAGPFLPLGGVAVYRAGGFGTTLPDGGDGAAERRYLETVELVTRQFNRYSQWLWREYQPRLLLDYFPYPDAVDHTWLGLVRHPPADLAPAAIDQIREARRAAYRLINERLRTLLSLAGPEDHVIITADHGMAAANRLVDVPKALEKAGLAEHAVHLRYSILLNTPEWSNGTIAAGGRDALLDQVESALRGIRDPETGQPVVTRVERIDPSGEELRADLLFDLLPGYAAAESGEGGVVTAPRFPFGTHGYAPDRHDMKAVFVAAGPRFPRGESWPDMQSIDIAPLVAELLGAAPPRNAQGRPPKLGADKPETR